MTFLIDNDYKTTLASLIANNELDAATIQELKELDVNDTYFIGITEVKRIAAVVATIKKIDEKNEYILVHAADELEAEKAVYKTSIFKSIHEAEITQVQEQDNNIFCFHYTIYVDYDNDFM